MHASTHPCMHPQITTFGANLWLPPTHTNRTHMRQRLQLAAQLAQA